MPISRQILCCVLIVGVGIASALSQTKDRLWLRNETQLTGTLVDSAITIHTPYGSLAIPFQRIQTVRFRSKKQGWDAIETTNHNRLVGIIHEPIKFLMPEAESKTYHPATLSRIEREQPAQSDLATRQFILLKNGDMLSGQLSKPQLNLSISGSEKTIEANTIESLRPVTTPTANVRVLLQDGSEQSAMWHTESLAFQLDLGPTVSISLWDLEAFYGRHGFIPQQVHRHFSQTPGGGKSIESPVPPIPGFVWIPPGRFLLGSDPSENGRGSDEGPQTAVTLTQGFWMAQHEVTQSEYQKHMGTNPSTFTTDPELPVEKVNWHEAIAYCRRLTEAAKAAGTLPQDYQFRLPTEAEWEYACRAGTDTRFSYGDDPSDSELSRFAWYVENSDSSTHPVGQLEPNPWGLYDMHGNVWEWCLDQWQYAYPGGRSRDFRATESGWLRVARGGSWLYSAANCRSANRDDYGPNNRCSDIGFRVVLAPE